MDLRSGDVQCDLCGGRVRLSPPNYVKVMGWVPIRARGGANGVRSPSSALGAAHRMCVDLLVRGEARSTQLTFPKIEDW